jgi:FixJ family two-component response regulator
MASGMSHESTAAAGDHRSAGIVYVVDDEPLVRSYLTRLLTSNGYQSAAFASADEMLERDLSSGPGCVLLDLFLPDLGGLQVQRILAERASHLPVLFMSGRGTVPLSVEAMKNGAMDFFTKPLDTPKLLQTIDRALERSGTSLTTRSQDVVFEERIRSLSPRQMEVIRLVSLGRLNKQIATELLILEKTVKVHRARAMRKLGVKSVAELVRLADRFSLSSYPLD